MPNVIHEVKLDFKDVLLRPKRSSIKSRADVEIKRKFTFLHSKVMGDESAPGRGIRDMIRTLFYKQSRSSPIIMRSLLIFLQQRVHEGAPIIASNMDTVGTFEMAAALAKVKS